MARLRKEWEESGDPRYRERVTPGTPGGVSWVWDQSDFMGMRLGLRLFRRWLLAACFHDLGYAAENLSTLSGALNREFFSKVPGYSISPFQLVPKPYLEATLEPVLERLAMLLLWDEWLPLSFTPREAEVKRSIRPAADIFRAGMEARDHGVMSAVFFVLTMMADLQELPIRVDFQDEIIEDVYAAGLAIALHNLRQTTYPGLVVNCGPHPISFMLMLSDELQEWDRTPFNTDLWDHLEHLHVQTLEPGQTPHAASRYLWALDFRFRRGTHPDAAKQSKFWHNLESLTTHNLAGGPSLRIDVDGRRFFEARSQHLPTDHWPAPVRPRPNSDYFVSEPKACGDPYCRQCQKKQRKAESRPA